MRDRHHHRTVYDKKSVLSYDIERNDEFLLKKMCLFILVMVLLTGSAFAEDTRVEIQFIVHQENSESAFTAEVLFRESEILVLSGLFPSFAFSVPGEYSGFSAIPDQDTTFNSFSLDDTGSVIRNILEQMNTVTLSGLFAGDLFDQAGTVTKGTVSFQELLSVLPTLNSSWKINPELFRKSFMQEVFPASGLPDLSGTLIQYNVFDDGKYLILNGLEKDKTVFTASFDFSVRNSLKAVIGHAEEGKNYYWIHDLSILSPDEFRLTSALKSDLLKQGYRSIITNPSIVTENWNVQLSENRKEISFDGEIVPENGKKTVEISGMISTESKTVFRAKIGFRDLEESYFTFSVSMDHLPVNTGNLKVLSLSDFTSSSEYDSFLTEISGNIIQFMLKLSQALPEDYR